ncbi:aldo/keto reductase [Henriciella pelagia]|jgi:diketogulonate reductase-like aldo/keto reductase|uniref:2,5-didehydrogluconate reductase n=1 Tax=Henriciella pelagia TaxID=1977912 RepID=A0ABQ1J9K5_9PROT|nr:aldo/keto reductase [Henriciella pelagia]GGB63452.1 2,5-didehydrogluconate reductase [Henriciella pelagia]
MTLTTRHFGVDIPKIGFGTWKLRDETAQMAVSKAIEAGYRMIDTAQAYENETHVGRGIADAQLPREELFVTTKVWMSEFKDGDLQDAVARSVERLSTDYCDLILLHWPNPDVPLEETLGALNDVHDKGLTRNIGVSNFTSAQLGQAVKLSRAPILTNQVEYHPFINQTPILEAAHALGSSVTAYSPLAQGRIFDDPVLNEIGEAHGKTPAQIVIRWCAQQPGVITIPRSSSPDHIASNNDVLDFELTADEMGRITALNAINERLINPSWAPEWDRAA